MQPKYMILVNGISPLVKSGRIRVFVNIEDAYQTASLYESECPDGTRYRVKPYNEKLEPSRVKEQEEKQLLIDGGPHLPTVANIRNILVGLDSEISLIKNHIEENGCESTKIDEAFKQIYKMIEELAQTNNT